MNAPVNLTPASIEPLARLARFSFDWASTLCCAEHGCADYHRAWSALRLLELDGAVPAGWRFFHDALGKLPEGNNPRVLVSGSADTGLTAIAAFALPGARIVVADRCATTLEQNRLFARHLGREFELHQGDLQALDCAPVDAVLAHSFLIFFTPAQQREVVNTWRRVLKPGGVLLMSNRLTTATTPTLPRHTEAELEARLVRLADRAASLGWAGADIEALRTTAQRFWSQPGSPRMAEAQLRALLDEGGFDLLQLDYDDSKAPSGPRSQTHAAQKGYRAEIIARRRPD